MLEKLEAVIQKEKPDWVLVYGDTDSTLAGALAASKLNIPVAHVEAGLRSFNRRMPEEINRVITDHLSSVLFVPTQVASSHLAIEGIAGDSVQLVGDVMYDAALYYKALARRPEDSLVKSLKAESFVLCTVHRAENTDNLDCMKGILAGLETSQLPVVLPVHPRTRARLNQMGLTMPSNVRVIDPVGYLEMVWLEMNCKLVVTDSGGVQKEAYFHGRPCITMRDETEWTELVDMGVNRLVGVDPARISEALSVDWSKVHFGGQSAYGSGNSGYLIAKYLNEH
jgi:UDP-GlcNAc3NAcA epimerase